MLYLVLPPPPASLSKQADGSHEELAYDYSEEWQEKLLGAKMLELGDISCLGAALVCVDPDAADTPRYLILPALPA